MKKIIFILLSFLNYSAFAQLQMANRCNVGDVKCMFQFKEFPPVYTYLNTKMPMSSYNAAYSDFEGNFKYFSNGQYIYNHNYSKLKNSKINQSSNLWNTNFAGVGMPGLGGGGFLESFQKDSLIYYVYPTLEIIDSLKPGTNSGTYSDLMVCKINLTNDSIIFKDSVLASGVLQMPAFVRHGNGTDWWVVCPENGLNNYYIIGIHNDSISVKKQTIGKSFGTIFDNGFGWNDFSLDGSIYVRNHAYEGIIVINFDRCKGELFNPKFVKLTKTEYFQGAGANVSANNRFLYSNTRNTILQFDLEANDIEASLDTVAVWDFKNDPFQTDFSMGSYGVDNKIYYSTYNGCLSNHVIDRPNLKGKACNVRQHAYRVPVQVSLTQMPIFVNYALKAIEPPCEE